MAASSAPFGIIGGSGLVKSKLPMFAEAVIVEVHTTEGTVLLRKAVTPSGATAFFAQRHKATPSESYTQPADINYAAIALALKKVVSLAATRIRHWRWRDLNWSWLLLMRFLWMQSICECAVCCHMWAYPWFGPFRLFRRLLNNTQGCKCILGICSVGSLITTIPVGSFVVTDDWYCPFDVRCVSTDYDAHFLPEIDDEVRSVVIDAVKDAGIVPVVSLDCCALVQPAAMASSNPTQLDISI